MKKNQMQLCQIGIKKGIQDEQMDDMEQLSYEESKRQAKERRDRGKNMIRPFTFDEEKILRDGLYNDDAMQEKKYLKEIDTGVIRWRYTDESPDKFG